MINETLKTIDAIIAKQKKARKEQDFLGIMLNGEALLEYLPAMIDYSVDQESAYRKYEAELTNKDNNGKAATSSYCETQAKASDFYKEWQRTKQFIELMYEMVQMSKALAKGVSKDFNTAS